MSQFDQTTERKAEDYSPSLLHRQGFTAGRNSAKESLEMLAKAVKEYLCCSLRCGHKGHKCLRCYAIAQVKARGDWPLEEA